MDGNGAIQVNHRSMKFLQYRLIIKLSNLQSNYDMLLKIAKVIGGVVRVVKTKQEVIWVVDNRETIVEIINIFTIYPPLTSKLTCQLEFLKVCLKKNSVKNYLKNRNLKYNNKLNIIKELSVNKKVQYYFPSWLSGFIEAKGCFLAIVDKNFSFSIRQTDDYYLLESIKVFFTLTVKVKNPYNNFFLLEIYKKESLNRIISHCKTYPLLGEKSQLFDKFIFVSQKK